MLREKESFSFSYLLQIDDASFGSYTLCVGQCRNFGKCMEVIVMIGKTNSMTNTWGETKTKTDKDMKVENKRTTVKLSNQLQRHLVSGIVTYQLATEPSVYLYPHAANR